MIRSLAAAASLAFAVATPLSAQVVSETSPIAGASDEVVVQALKIPREELPTQVYWNLPQLLTSRIVTERSTLFLRCAIKRDMRAFLRQAVDGEPNSVRARTAQARIILNGVGCQPGLPERDGYTNRRMTIAEYGESTRDRGIIVELMLHQYAPDAQLTRDQTKDPDIKSRFLLREGPRNRLRLPNDRDAFRVTACLVGDQPELATRLLHSPAGSQLEQGLVQAMLVDGRSCLGTLKRVTIDPSSFRGYVADAFYRWMVAARGETSLIPLA